MEFKKIVYPTWTGSRAPPGVYNRHNALTGRSQSVLISRPEQCYVCGWLSNSHLAHSQIRKSKYPPEEMWDMPTHNRSPVGATPQTFFHSYPAVTSACSPIVETVLLMDQLLIKRE